jgi:hypothetical protein
MPMPSVDGPDFICIGLPKAGTGWLYDQLEVHPSFWMPPVKELVYLNHPYPPLGFVDSDGKPYQRRRDRKAHKSEGWSRASIPERLVSREFLDERDLAFLRRASKGRGKPMDLEFYASLFACKGDRLSGDITPPYCNLREETIERVAKRFPETKIILLLRDPVARAWSRICMAHEAGNFDLRSLLDADALRTFIKTTHKIGGIRATAVYERWRKVAPYMDFRFFFFDHIASEPEKIRREMLLYLGADPDKENGGIPPDYNRKAKVKLEMTPLAQELLTDYFCDELSESAKVFGGPAHAWVAAHGL